MKKTESKQNRSQTSDIKIKNFKKYEKLINEKCKDELKNNSMSEYLDHFRNMNKEQLNMFKGNFAVLERMSEVPKNKLDLPKMVDQWAHSIKVEEADGIDRSRLLDNFKDW